MGKARNARGADEEKTMDLQAGVRVYQFVRDRQDDLRDEQHPEGHDAYVQSWRDAHELSQEYANAVQAGNISEARRCLDALMTMASQWKSHPDIPAATSAVRAAHDADLIPER
ncbi:hypothetical protein GCM10010372_83000 [Streptomyces tauricus]|uniref:hypothetical protein n=1 Tax=Streptomyces tauricus TaxID=68274 RepID=UPI00167C2064|nr:hypothetical protein [Streptomyces tauricus]GHA71405.1 hypothetical protein GCM10010372_83000 [Streptomyces tauricus]